VRRAVARRSYLIGPVRVAFSTADSVLARWARVYHASREVEGPPDLVIELARSADEYRAPTPPLALRTGDVEKVSYIGWRVTWVPETNHATALLSKQTDDVRGPRRVAAIARTLVGRYLLRRRGLPFHAAAMIHDGQGYLFVGRRGAGKTTLVRLFPGESVLGDDHALVVCEAGGVRVYGTPYSVREGTPSQPGSAPLAAILVRAQDATTRVEALSRAVAFKSLTPHIIHHGHGRAEVEEVFDIMDVLTRRVPVARLRFNRTDPMWPVVSAA